ncbi:hypothetical protein [Kitasatospora sp. NPDC091207]|uniref:hypothetical protein n=1 Tax=Kitasatospora sp. NPDC091207 TaxID=3364083 RepID=UPI0037F8929A
MRLTKVHFLNGDLANDQVSSWLNNSQCQIEFWDGPNGTLLTNFTSPFEYLDLTRSSTVDVVTVTRPGTGTARLHWLFRTATG